MCSIQIELLVTVGSLSIEQGARVLLELEVYLSYLDGRRLIMGIDKAIPGLGREPKTQYRVVITADEIHLLQIRLSGVSDYSNENCK